MLDPKSICTQWRGESEDKILAFFKDRADGFFVDIGSNNGFDGSQTRELWQKGWSGVMVEADSRAFAQLKENYGDDPRLKLIHGAVSVRDGEVTFFEWKGAPTFSSMDRRWVAQHGFDKFQPVRVRSFWIGSLGLPAKFDFLKIDTEGLDTLIIESMPTEMKPTLIMAEVNKADGEKAIRLCLERRGYKMAWCDDLNVGYAL